MHLVCETPFASVEDLSRIKRIPASTLRERLSKLRRLGLAEAHPHRLAKLSDRPLRRYVPTAAGIAALGSDDLLRRHPVSRQWLAARLRHVRRVRRRRAQAVHQPVSASTPMCSFMPKCQLFPFFVW